MTEAPAKRTDYRLSDRVESIDQPVAMSGIQALIRAPLDQIRADAEDGRRTAAMISGYRGSPVGGMDQAYEADRVVLEANNVEFISGVNEDLGATIVWGSQQAAMEASARFDGVLGMWYGKGPGVDRSGDALRHANTSGVDPRGGVLAVAGDDPSCKSSTIASASEWALADLVMPTLYPGSVQDVLDFARFGYELSRFSGAWVGFKIVTNVADGFATVNVDPARLDIVPTEFMVDGTPWRHAQSSTLIAPFSLTLEEEMMGARLDAAKHFVATQGLDRIIGATETIPARVGIVAAGTMYGELRGVLGRFGLRTDDQLAEAGVRIYKPAMIWPLEPGGLRRFANGLGDIVVIEEKRSFIESQIRDLLYNIPDAPWVFGKTDPGGQVLFPGHGGLLADDLVEPLRRQLERLLPEGTLASPPPERTRIAVTASDASIPGRAAHFCSGCPHNRSTLVPEGSIAHGGIGCHSMSLYMDREVHGVTHMGGEGAQWVGMAPFIDDGHRFQNLGDGTLAHSGSLAIRQAIAAGTDITYKILYNGTVAMTGGQDAAGDIPVPELTRALEAEGVSRIVVVADDPSKYTSGGSGARLGAAAASATGLTKPPGFAKRAQIVHRDKLDEIQKELREVEGVSILIYDQACAAELRRGRKRGTITTPTTRVVINEDICEGCGDCGEVSNCASVHPVQTPFGRKTQIHQESCNYDLTCLQGNCPAFMTIEVDPDHRPSKVESSAVPDGPIPDDPTLPDEANILLVGIGGTGVVTVSQILATAALLDGKTSNGLDQTGLAQKGGPVVSNLRISNDDAESSNRVGTASADAMLVFDLLTATKNLDRAAPDRTIAIVSTGLIPTGAMVSGRASETFPELDTFRSAINGATRSADNVWLDAGGVARRVWGSQPAANTLVLGIAYQRGLLPMSGMSIERAIELNGVAVGTNLDAFRLGRRLAADPMLLADLDEDPSDIESGPPVLTGPAASLAATVRLPGGTPGDDLGDILAWRIPELIEWGDVSDAAAYVEFVRKVRDVEEAVVGDRTDLSQAVGRYLYKLMAYKDEYEVARLALRASADPSTTARFGPDAKLSFQLKPPTMKAIGVDRKIAIPEAAAKAMFEGLLKTKRLRGTRFDPFGRSEERKIERALISEYRDTIDQLLGSLSADSYDRAVEIASLPDMIRGFDTVKLANVDRYRARLAELLE